MPNDVAQATIAIVGAGFIGRSWATLFARHGHSVIVQDPDVEALASVHAAIRTSLDQLAEAGLVDGAPEVVLNRIATATNLEAAVAEADYVQENAPERLEVKRALFTELDRLAPARAILASSSSSLTCGEVCGDLQGRARCLVAHPANPPHLLRAVEVVPAAFTDSAVTARAAAILRGVGQVPVVIGEIDGFVMNRLQAALAREALALVESGVADAHAIDDVVKHSLGPRWAFMGPFETMDLNAPEGFRDYAQRYGVAFARLFDEEAWSAGAVDEVDQAMRADRPLDSLDSRREWRDRRLAALIAHLGRQPDD
jgi:3-hydroxyacyl-CoA dehydrogenase